MYEENQKLVYKDLPRDVYCEYAKELETTCFEQSLLGMWMYEEDVINQLSNEEILYAINVLDRSPYLGLKFDYSKLLGSIKRNSTGHIVSATAALYNFVTVVDLTKTKKDSSKFVNARNKILDEENILWQDEAIRAALGANGNSSISGKICCRYVTLLLLKITQLSLHYDSKIITTFFKSFRN